MKKIVVMFTLLFAFSSAVISCRENPNEATEVELNNDELEVNDDVNTTREGDTINEVPREQGVGEIDDEV